MRKTVLTVAAATAIFAGCADAFSPMPLAMPRARATSSVSSLRMSEDASAVLARMNAMMNGGTYTPPAPAAYSPPPPAAYSPPPPAAYSPPPAAPAAYQPPAAPASPPAAAPPAAPAPSSKAFSWDPPDVTSAKINAVLNSPSVLNHPSRGQKEVSVLPFATCFKE
jgi:hypothetical protein